VPAARRQMLGRRAGTDRPSDRHCSPSLLIESKAKS
jgi:hypothetical protein